MSAFPISSFSDHDLLDVPLFPDIIKGTFISRSNRFVIRCAVEEGISDADLPNPGRLWELLLPGRIVYLVRRPPGASGSLAHTAVAVERKEIPLLRPLHSFLVRYAGARRLVEGG
jgi:sugar fermentation stimulation protein A